MLLAGRLVNQHPDVEIRQPNACSSFENTSHKKWLNIMQAQKAAEQEAARAEKEAQRAVKAAEKAQKEAEREAVRKQKEVRACIQHCPRSTLLPSYPC